MIDYIYILFLQVLFVVSFFSWECMVYFDIQSSPGLLVEEPLDVCAVPWIELDPIVVQDGGQSIATHPCRILHYVYFSQGSEFEEPFQSGNMYSTGVYIYIHIYIYIIRTPGSDILTMLQYIEYLQSVDFTHNFLLEGFVPIPSFIV